METERAEQKRKEKEEEERKIEEERLSESEDTYHELEKINIISVL